MPATDCDLNFSVTTVQQMRLTPKLKPSNVSTF